MKLQRSIRHPSIIKFYYVYEDKHNISIVTEYFEWGTLQNRIWQKGSLTEYDAWLLIKKLLEVIMYIHDRGLVHRDIRPGSILMASQFNDYEIKLSEFGLWCMQDSEDMEIYCGTPGFMAPEIWKIKPYNQPVDIYGVGIVMYVALSGQVPFQITTNDHRDILAINASN